MAHGDITIVEATPEEVARLRRAWETLAGIPYPERSPHLPSLGDVLSEEAGARRSAAAAPSSRPAEQRASRWPPR